MYKKTKTKFLSVLLTAAVTLSGIGLADTATLHAFAKTATGKAVLKTKK